MSIEIRKISITEIAADAIVNAANEHLAEGGGVCGAIFSAAGSAELTKACAEIGGCATGRAVITPGFRLLAKYIIHAVGPVWRGGNSNEPQLLYGAYHTALELAVQNGCRSIAFPLISAGIFGYPKEQAWRTAVQACRDFRNENPGDRLRIIFAVLDDGLKALGERSLASE
ncbi:MAG: macro domain-containing protein [Oscillospiraceae bacterium]|nr:macro domain-containing protein [Oscillospiraceae bacterium]